MLVVLDRHAASVPQASHVRQIMLIKVTPLKNDKCLLNNIYEMQQLSCFSKCPKIFLGIGEARMASADMRRAAATPKNVHSGIAVSCAIVTFS